MDRLGRCGLIDIVSPELVSPELATGCKIVEGGNARGADMRLSCERTQMVVFEASSGSGDRRVTLVSAVYLRPR